MKSLLIALMLTFLTGCAVVRQNELHKWSDANKSLAQSGQIKWSDYYTQLFDKIEEADLGIHRGPALQATNGLIASAKQYERGQITKEQFENAQRSAKAQVANARAAAIANDDDDDAVSAGFNSMAGAFKQNQQYFQNKIDRQFTCTRNGNTTNCR